MATKLNFTTRTAGQGSPTADINLIAPTIDSVMDDVAARVLLTDARLTDARTPLAHTQSASTVTGLATVATSGAYADLTGKPVRPTLVDASRPIAYAGFAAVIERLNYVSYPPTITRAVTSNLTTDFANRASLTYA